eukprot:jgi/Antlo1/1878/49
MCALLINAACQIFLRALQHARLTGNTVTTPLACLCSDAVENPAK